MDARMFVEQDMTSCELADCAGGAVAVQSFRCPGKETPNEDAAALLAVGSRRAILVVADGVGGQPAGRRAAAIAIQSVKACLDEQRDDTGLRGIILNAFERANEAVTALGVGAATTLSVVEIDGDIVRSYHAGDSMIIVTGQRGRLKLKTVSHSPTGYAVESGYLDEDEAMHHEDRHLVLNMVGTADMHIEVGPPVRLNRRDTVVLASDGLFDNLLVDEIVDIVRAGPLARAATTLATAARRRMETPEPDHPSKSDDMTFILYRPGTTS
jgi:serine/threonine protein phosphatase PrpC